MLPISAIAQGSKRLDLDGEPWRGTLVHEPVAALLSIPTSKRKESDHAREYPTRTGPRPVLSACVASCFPKFQRVGLEMITTQGAIFGWGSNADNFIEAVA